MIHDTVCRLCSSCCPIHAEIENDRLISAWRKSFLEPEKRLVCPKLNHAPDIVYSDRRLTTPLVKTNNGGFREADWNEALDKVVELMTRHKQEAGPQSVSWLRGMAADWGAPWDYPNRLMHCFGSPNTIGNGSICFVSRDFAHSYTYGSMAFPEAKSAQCIIVWGKHDGNTALGAAEGIAHAQANGATLIVVDPVRTSMAAKADIWLQIKPGHDALLAMAMIHEIINHDWCNTEFITNYTIGFDALKSIARNYTPEAVADDIWLSAEQIREVARLYGTTRPASIVDGNGLDMQRDVFDSTRAIAMLRAITGNLDIQGGDVIPQPVPVRNIQMKEKLANGPESITKHYALFNTFSETWGNQVQGCIIDGILDQVPYPLKMVVVQSGNPLVTMADSSRTREAFQQLESLVVIDMFMTETAKLADVILPASSCFEKTQLNRSSIRNNPIILQNEVIRPLHNSWPDWKIVFELGRRLGFTDEFPWHTAEEAINYQLEPTGITVNQLRDNPNGLRVAELRYKKYEQDGFSTPSGHVEFVSNRLAAKGFPATPLQHGMVNPISFSDRAEEFPIIGISGARDIRFTNSQFFTIPGLVQNGTGCCVDIHPEDAKKMGITEGTQVAVETPKGKIKMEARIASIVRPGSIRIAWGWGDYKPQSGLNLLTENDNRSAVTGTSSCRSFMCRVTPLS
ncbi:molybdopterin-dependent oxidoreductase [Desulfopila sp. IMCC35008]|uniref:molybdopterin-containing oxidoreductase family protein n=1 Tax=Desulfopila sp. IMCC35008 TaxID=2653858 RepID=UPI0013D0ABED|nr:molybdopterin-dependent oxidoreductase [Desulfopila sp. IMCC35008]